jgi:hypothetical protein
MLAADPNGAEPFKVYDRRSASVRYADASDEHGLKFIADESDTLHIRFRRGVNSTCSIPKDAQQGNGVALHQTSVALRTGDIIH